MSAALASQSAALASQSALLGAALAALQELPKLRAEIAELRPLCEEMRPLRAESAELLAQFACIGDAQSFSEPLLRHTRPAAIVDVTSTPRTAGCGPACPVVWQGNDGAQ